MRFLGSFGKLGVMAVFFAVLGTVEGLVGLPFLLAFNMALGRGCGLDLQLIAGVGDKYIFRLGTVD